MRWAIAVVLMFAGSNALAETVRLTCEHAQGNRIMWVGNPATPAEHRDKLQKGDDAISGIRLEITYQTVENVDAAMIISGNQNLGGHVLSVKLVRLSHPDYVSFIGVDPEDNSTMYLLSYFPKLQKIIWTSHGSRLGPLDQLALSKQFIMDCR